MYNLDRLLNTGVGIEVEVENVPDIPTPKGWIQTQDPSLRNNGAEFVTLFGSRLKDVPKLVQALFSRISKIRDEDNRFFDFNERTSIHVHLDARKLSVEELKTLILLYIIFEDSLFKFAGESRKHNIFCVPLRYVAMSEVIRDSFLKTVGRWQKYCAFNLIRLKDYGTVEFRHMEGHCDPDRLINWILILTMLMDYARSHSLKEVMEEINQLKYASHYPEFISNIFGDMSEHIVIDPAEFDAAISDTKLFFKLKV